MREKQMQVEYWKDIQGYEGQYQVSNLGRVKSLGNKSNHKGEILLRQSTVNGYKHVSLSNNSLQQIHKVHRLVAVAFIDNPKNYPQVNHKDGNKQNNRVENLEWCNAQENALHAQRMGLRVQKKGAENSRSIKVKQIDPLTNETINVYGGLREMEKVTGFTRANVKRVLNDDKKRAYGWRWERC